MDKTEIQNVSNAIANACMDQLDTWERNVTRDINKKGYAGLERRVLALKMKLQREYGSKYLKNALTGHQFFSIDMETLAVGSNYIDL